jgi:ATP/maltotriose-dependent transcriptional regulator MalT/DNA-binding SARP family transcriptional activator
VVVAAYIPPPRDPVASLAPPARPVESERTADEHVERPSVNELLDRAANSQICVVIGAAGWGKTTAVETWSRDRPRAWLHHEDHEGSAERLLTSLFAALRVHIPTPAEGMAAWDTEPASAAAICHWVQSFLSKDLLLVIDDLHELQPGSDAAGVVESLCQHAPDRLHLVLISRRDMPFSLQRLRGRGRVAEIHAADLAFDVADVEALLRKTVGKDPPGLAKHVWEYTGGWATALRSAVEMLRMVGADQRLATVERLSHPGERFHDYLAEEVLGTAPEWALQLLRRLSIFGEIYGADGTATGLTELSRQGLVRRCGGQSVGASLVRPLRDYFEFGAPPPAHERHALHVSAANECLARGAPEQALRHLLAAGDHAACASLLVDHGDAMVEHGAPEAVVQAKALPAEYLDDPRIQRVLGLAHQARGQWTQALEHYQRAGQDRHQVEPALAWRVGWITFALGEFAEVDTLTRRTRLDRRDTLDEIRVLALAANAHWMSGNVDSLRRAALQTRTAARQHNDPRAWSRAHQVFALLAATDGDWRQTDAHFVDALRNAEASADLLALTWIRACQAHYQFEAGAPQQALADAQIALSLGERCDNPFFIAHALTTRGRARARLGALETAAGDFTTASDLLQRLGSRFLAWPLCGLGDLHRTRGQLVRARAAYEEALALAEPYHDVFALSAALIGLARIDAADDPRRAREQAKRAVKVATGGRWIPSVLARGWIALIDGDRESASEDADRAAVAARQRRDNPGLAEAITLSVLASRDPAMNAVPLRDAIEIWQETGCRLEEAATRIVAARLGAVIPHLDAHRAEGILRDYGVDVDSRRAAGPLRVLVHSSPAVSIQTLGMFLVLRDGVPIPNTAWQSKKARDLLKILVARRRPTPREQLMELLWPGVDPTVAGNRLSVLLSTVRDVLQPEPAGDGPLVATDGAVSLNRAQVRIDVEDFLTLANTAFDAYRAAEPDATTQLVAAVAAYTGDFLENDPYHEWASAIAEEVRAAHIALLRALTARLRDEGATDDAVRYTLRLLEQDRYDEEAYRTLIGVLFHGGRLGEARRHYQNYVRRMAEIDVRPSPFPEMTSQQVITR